MNDYDNAQEFIKSVINVKDKDIEDVSIVKADDNTRIIDLKLKRIVMFCDICGQVMISNGHRLKTINNPVFRNYKTIVRYHVNRYYCKYCKVSKMQKDPLSYEGQNASYVLLYNVMKQLKCLNYTLDMISKEFNISTTSVNNYLDSYVVIRKRRLPEWIGIDEVCNRSLSYKRSSYLCVITDCESRRLFEVLGSRSKNYLYNYFDYNYTYIERCNVKYVTIDMWEPYRDDALKLFPNCIVAVDPFHFVKHLCDDFERVRIKIMNKQLYGSQSYYLLKKFNWLLEKEDIDLDNEPKYNKVFREKLNYNDIFNMIIETFPNIKEAYYLKEGFRDYVKDTLYIDAERKYYEQLELFKNCNIEEYREFTNILITWKKEIINSFYRPYDDKKLSNAYTERVNGEIKKYINVSRGINNFVRFRKRVLYSLNDDIGYSLKPRLDYSTKRKIIKDK